METMNMTLEPIIEPKLFKVVKAISKSRSPEPNKVVVKFYVKFSHVLREWYCKIRVKIQHGTTNMLPRQSFKVLWKDLRDIHF
jgi:hypothetical protein